MRDSIFRRYVIIFVSTLVLSTMILGVALMLFSGQNFTADKQEHLRNAAEQARELVLQDLVRLPDGSVGVNADVEAGFKTIAQSSGAVVYLCDPAGNVVICSEGDKCGHTAPIPPQILEVILKRGSYSYAGYLDGVIKNTRGLYIHGVAVGGPEAVAGYVFASMPIMPLFSFLINLGITFLAAAGVMLIGAMLIIYTSTKRLTQPLREMSAAAKSFAAGDFSARVAAVAGNDEIAHLALAFNNMAESLDEQEKARRSFVGSVSHELRTPMTTIGGYIEGILDGTIPPEQQEHYLTIASDEVKRLSRLTASLLSITRMEEGATKVAVVNTDMWDTVLSVLWNAERRILDKGICLEDLAVKPAYVLADEDMLHQVVYNLVDNAIKFTPEGGNMSIKVEQNALETTLRVRNSGDGMDSEEMAHVFERFYKTDKSRSLDKTGTGLGLYIVKMLMDRMEGSISVRSELGEYTEFAVTLPTGAEDRKKERDIPVFATPKPQTEETDGKKDKPSWLGRLPFGRKKGK